MNDVTSERWNLHRFVFWMILTFAAVVRLKGLSSGLPLHTLYGENDTLAVLQQMLYTGNLNPNQFVYPGLSYYLHLPFLYGFYWIGVWTGHFNEMTSVPQASLIFVGRFVCAIFGTLSVILIYRIGLYFGRAAALIAMAILAASPQHIEFSHMLRPEVPAVFFAVATVYAALSLSQHPTARRTLIMGLLAGASFSVKYNIGLPLIFTMILALWLNRKNLRALAFIAAPLGFAIAFIASNPYIAGNPSTILSWIQKMDSYYQPLEDYYERNVVSFYVMYLIRYNYQLPLILLSIAGLIIACMQKTRNTVLASAYPIAVFIWLCTFDVRRVQELLPLHPFIGLWAGIALDSFWKAAVKRRPSNALTAGYLILLTLTLLFPFYHSFTQSFLYSKTDNRGKAELWITNHLPQGSKIALLQYHQIELDPNYFEVDSFAPRDYVGQREFQWFVNQGFDYVVLSSGQYMRYFTEGAKAQKFKDYFQKFFADAQDKGSLVLDLTTHPTLIPDYRIKVYSTKQNRSLPEFSPAVVPENRLEQYRLTKSGDALLLPPGYYSLLVPQERDPSYFIRVQNLKLDETILQRSSSDGLSAAENGTENFPFAILPERLSANFSLFSHVEPDVTPNQHVQFDWKGVPKEIQLINIHPPLEILSAKIDVKPAAKEMSQPFIMLNKNERFKVRCDLVNRSAAKVTGHAEAFLSEVGESQPWKQYETGSDIQEYVLEPGQVLPIEIPLTTNRGEGGVNTNLTGDYQLSFWIFTRQDLPFIPQNGAWFNKQIRVQDPLLGIHPIYRIPIP
ncbi:glycosyltransferase family 39 protein [bacterium]|nr:glycosyltransferase family 39 protein [bacterium]